MKKVFAVFLSILTVVTAFCACKKESPNSKESKDSSNLVSNEYTPDVPESDFGGATFTVMCRDPEMAWGELAIVTDEESTTVLGDASYKRNRRLENDYHIKIDFVTYNDAGASGDSFYQTLFQNLQAYDDICDICIPGIIDAATLTAANAFYDLSSGDVPYVNLEQPWWNHSLNESIAILNRQYFAISDALLNDKLDTYVMFFNKTLFADNNLEEPYALVDSGEWTFDAFANIVKTYGSDVNGNDSPDYEDRFGFVGFIYDVFYVGSGVKGAILNKETGLPEMTRFSDKIDDIYQKSYALIKGTDPYYTYSVGQETLYNGDVNDTFAAAFDTKSLFMCGPLMFYFNIITDMASDVGVLPCPKYDEDQSGYHHRAGYNGATAMTVLTTVRNVERAGIILEAFCAESKNYISPAFYETLLTNRYAQDEESKRMISLIIETEEFDLDQIYRWGAILESLQGALGMGQKSIASLYGRYITAAETKLTETVDSFKALQEK